MGKEIEALERIKDGIAWLGYDGKEVGMYKKDFEIIETVIKALEIIKKRGLNIKVLNDSKDVVEYNEEIKNQYGIYLLTTEEYDLLREVLKVCV